VSASDCVRRLSEARQQLSRNDARGSTGSPHPDHAAGERIQLLRQQRQFVTIGDEPMTDPDTRHGHGIDRALKWRTCRIHGSTQWAKIALPV